MSYTFPIEYGSYLTRGTLGTCSDALGNFLLRQVESKALCSTQISAYHLIHYLTRLYILEYWQSIRIVQSRTLQTLSHFLITLLQLFEGLEAQVLPTAESSQFSYSVSKGSTGWWLKDRLASCEPQTHWNLMNQRSPRP